jgi:formylglycine-generating enzyme required for sulfatase activity
VNGDLATRFRKLHDAYTADVIDTEAYEAGLTKLRREYGDAAVAALQEAEAPVTAASGRSATVTGQIDYLFQGDIQGHVFINGRREQEPAKLLAGYLRHLAHRCGALPLQALREQRAASDMLDISLDQVYTQLATTVLLDRERFAVAALTEAELSAYLDEHTGANLLPLARRTAVRGPDATRRGTGDPDSSGRLFSGEHKSPDLDRVNAADLLRLFSDWGMGNGTVAFQGPQLVTEAIAATPRLVLLGEPGSGKSTALRYLARSLARAGLEEDFAPAEHLEGWASLESGGRLLPILVPLRPFAQQLEATPDRPAGAADLWNYLVERVEDHGRFTGLGAAIHTELDNGNVLLLLDGLDEVAGEHSRHQVVRAVQAFAAEYHQCRMVVSCRVRAYEGERNEAWQLHGWPTVTLAEWTIAQMRHFARAWYAAVPGLPAERRSSRADSLSQAIDARPDLQRLGVRPLLMTIMALVHLNDQGQLPEGRVALYNRCVDLLLAQWELAREDGTDYGTLLQYIGLPNTDVKTLRPLLEDVAYLAHSAAGPASRGTISATDLHMLVATFLETKGHPNPFDGARKFLVYTDDRAGLLQASEARDAYSFPHQTFQEYLSGRALVRNVEYVQRILAVRNDDRWRVPILLGVGHLAGEGAMAMVSALLMELIALESRDPAQEGQDLLLAAEIGADLGWSTLERNGATFTRLKRELATGLARQVEQTALPANERVRAGIYLADLGDPRPGVCDLPPPMIRITGGTFVIGSTADEAAQAGIAYERYWRDQGDQKTATRARRWPQNEINADPLRVDSFELARYPVTNAQYKLFIDAGGYRADAPWWCPAGRAWRLADQPDPPNDGWRRRAEKDAPWFWDDPDVGIARPNCPVVGICWYEATAFCAWLTEYLNDGYVYRLPSEAEWEFAARGMERRVYAWGNEQPDAERANFNQTHNGTTAVGCFPAGATPEGLLDMAGNVWEWTRSEFRDYPYDPNDGRESGADPAKKRFTLRGGSWDELPITLRAADRDLIDPVFRDNIMGLRLARHRKV